MSITTINSTMQAQIMQDVQRMQANACTGAARHDLQFHRPGRFV
ncbi:hypothetical protein ECZU34_37740 [Escherichia coli]|nr:hypothetical protein ECZU34_37740 [Escherichia coli]